MSYWIEMHCDAPMATAPNDEYGPMGRCAIFTCDYPAVGARNKPTTGTWSYLFRLARNAGWKYRRVGDRMCWVCPACHAHNSGINTKGSPWL